MLGAVFCLIAAIAAYYMGRKSLGKGLLAVMVTGYFYGILRANILSPFSHFIFDCALIGLYASQPWSRILADRRIGFIKFWALLLIAWPCLVALLPFQSIAVTLVGLRGNVFFLPVLLLGAMLTSKDINLLVRGFVVLNVIAFAFAGAEYFLGIERFYPVSPVTIIIYASHDAGDNSYRIPAIFTSAHAFAGSIVTTIPFLFAGWLQQVKQLGKLLMLASLFVCLMCILLASTRTHFVVALLLIVIALLGKKVSAKKRAIWIACICVIGVIAASNQRFERFKTLGDTEGVTERVAGSVNRNFWEVLAEYPMGNGLGGGGTSLPYFLQDQLRNPISLENEYARIMLEQGVIGLMIWIGFIFAFVVRRVAFSRCEWKDMRRLSWVAACTYLATACIGLGAFTSIPQSVILLLCMGYISVKPVQETEEQVEWSGPAALPAPAVYSLR